MFGLFKRTTRGATAPAGHRANRSSAPREIFVDPIPVPEVVEGNDHADWKLWEDSFKMPLSPLPEQEERSPAAHSAGDPFGNVGKNRDL